MDNTQTVNRAAIKFSIPFSDPKLKENGYVKNTLKSFAKNVLNIDGDIDEDKIIIKHDKFEYSFEVDKDKHDPSEINTRLCMFKYIKDLEDAKCSYVGSPNFPVNYDGFNNYKNSGKTFYECVFSKKNFDKLKKRATQFPQTREQIEFDVLYGEVMNQKILELRESRKSDTIRKIKKLLTFGLWK